MPHLENLTSHWFIAASSFAVTNIDDLLILSIYFATPQVRIFQVIAGQYLGIVALIVVSLAGIVAGTFLDARYIAWLGVVPILLGLKGLYHLYKNNTDKDDASAAQSGMALSIISVATVTIANGGDNIGVYAPLFARVGLQTTILYAVVFLIMTGAWCALGHYAGRRRLVRNIFERYGKVILPFFLILLGLWIIGG